MKLIVEEVGSKKLIAIEELVGGRWTTRFSDGGYISSEPFRTTESVRRRVFTGFLDKDLREIYDGDILSDKVEVDGEIVSSSQQVFWCTLTGSWRLDESFSGDKSASILLSKALASFEYKVAGNVFEKKK